MITIPEMMAAGFHEFALSPSVQAMHPHADKAFQKCIRDPLGKRYYITVWYYDHRAIKAERGLTAMSDDGWLFDVQLYTDDAKRGFFNTGYSPAEVDSVADVEAFFAKLWQTMSGVYYDREET